MYDSTSRERVELRKRRTILHIKYTTRQNGIGVQYVAHSMSLNQVGHLQAEVECITVRLFTAVLYHYALSKELLTKHNKTDNLHHSARADTDILLAAPLPFPYKA